MSSFTYAKHESPLRAAGIPWRDPHAVFKCVRRIHSGSAYYAAMLYFQDLAKDAQFPQACQSLYTGARRLSGWYSKCASEAW